MSKILFFFIHHLSVSLLLKNLAAMKLSLPVLLVLLFSFSVSAQQISIDQLKALKPRNIGPAGMSGRITAVDVVVADHDTW
ncbi:MAG TPA: hypothetical protein VFR58_11060, partial [Flavisolibacter sp.]|nr:hypothetical protein [Flavisolibacter sp.]